MIEQYTFIGILKSVSTIFIEVVFFWQLVRWPDTPVLAMWNPADILSGT